MSYSPDSPNQFFIFSQMLNAFFHIVERSDAHIAVLPYKKLQQQVEHVYTDCGATLAEPPHLPTPAQIDAMKFVNQWGKELSDVPKYQLQLFYDPQFANSRFVDCFSANMTKWVDDYNKQQQSSDNTAVIGIVSFIGAAVLLTVIGCVIYQRWKRSSRFPEGQSGIYGSRAARYQRGEPVGPQSDHAYQGVGGYSGL